MTESNGPHVPGWFQGGFHRFLRPYLKRHFHAIGVEQIGLGLRRMMTWIDEKEV